MSPIGMKTQRTQARDLKKAGLPVAAIARALEVDEDQVSEWLYPPRAARADRRTRGISEASPEQRAKVKDRVSILGGEGPCDPCHIWPRSLGGCDDPLCVFPATREEHRAFDQGHLDVLPALLAHGYVAELQHALGHANGDLLALLERVTGDTYVPRLRDPD